nr:pentatricopeptide repeat-containing protein [Quercus suber]
MKNILICIVADDNLQCPVSIIVSLIEEDGFNEPKFVVKLCDMLMRVYSDNRMCEEAVGVFDYMEKNGFEIEERSCFVLLLALKKCDRVESCFEFFRQMVESDVEITVYAMTSVIDGLCRRGEVERGRELMAEIVGRGIKPNVITYNTFVNAYVERKDFRGVNEEHSCASQYKPHATVSSDTELFLVPGLPHPVYITMSQMPVRFFGNLGLHEFFEKFMEAERDISGIGVKTGLAWGEEENIGVLVDRDHVEEVVTRLMGESEAVQGMRNRVSKLSKLAMAAISKGGSSYVNMVLLIEDLLNLRRDRLSKSE